MLINSLVLENFGLFSGKQIFDLKPIKNKNIILIGGKNGNGKTTFFEAIRLCLYGPRMMDKNFKKGEYESYLLKRIHHSINNKQVPDYASIEVEFQHAVLGQVDTYSVKRVWYNNPKDINEQFEIKKNQLPLEEFDSDQWQDFINDLIPPGLSQLFFFDGEKIQNLAEDIDDNKQLSESFKSLLGIDLIEKLKSDLDIYTLKELRETGTKELKDKIDLLEDKEKSTEQKIDYIRQEKAQTQSNIDQLITELEHLEGNLISEGGGFAKKRDDLKQQKAQIDFNIQAIETTLRERCAENLLTIFSKKLNNQIRSRLQEEEELKNNEIAKKSIMSNLSIIKKEIPDLIKDDSITKSQINLITNKIIEKMDILLTPNKKNIKIVHNLSSEDTIKLIMLIDQTPKIQQELESLTKEHEQLCKKRLQLGRELSFAADNNTVAPHLAKISELNKELGSLNEKNRIKNEELSQVTIELEKTRREIAKVLDEIEGKNGVSDRTQLVNKIQSVLTEYHTTLKDQKIREFSEIFLESYNHLARKKNIFERIELNPVTFNVTLFKQGNREILKKELSAGEKQIYAIAVLWTLTKISNRPLPFIIDTPLGRLDVAHRDNIVLNFLPSASHQIIILSTDTEIDNKYLAQLKKYIAKEFLLNYENGETIVEKGYFWS